MICPQVRSTGVCHDLTCIFQHDMQICVPCGVVCTSSHTYKAHLAGKRHRSKLTGRAKVLHCTACERNIPASNWSSHIGGKPHEKQVRIRGLSSVEVEPEEAASDDVPQGYSFCALCERAILTSSWTSHTNSPSHRKKEVYTSFKAAFDEAEKDKHGITVSHAGDFGIVEVVDAGRGVVTSLVVRTTVPPSQVSLVDVKLSSNPLNASP